MGADGTGPFENDDAMDFLDDVLEEERSSALSKAIRDVLKDQTYIDSQEGTAAVAAAAIVAVGCGCELAEKWAERDDIAEWIEGLDPVERRKVTDLRPVAAAAMERLTEPERSELCDQWNESGSDAWRSDMTALIAALRGTA